MSAPLLHRLRGHAWTVMPSLASNVRRPPVPYGEPFEAAQTDPLWGSVRVTGQYHPWPCAQDLLVAVHGLGGSIDSPYMARPATAAHSRGMSCLRLNLRGADRGGDDIYHAGLTQDLDAALAAPLLSGYRNIFVLGFSMGGHMVLRWALAPTDARVRALCSVCSPLDLSASRQVIDRPRKYIYRRHVLDGLRQIHAAAHARGRARVTPSEAARIRSLGDWDERIVAPRFGFASAAEYWQAMSVGPRLHELALPSLVLATALDPMVTEETLRPSLGRLRAPSEVRWIRGGHLGFPPGTELETLALDWMRRFGVTQPRRGSERACPT